MLPVAADEPPTPHGSLNCQFQDHELCVCDPTPFKAQSRFLESKNGISHDWGQDEIVESYTRYKNLDSVKTQKALWIISVEIEESTAAHSLVAPQRHIFSHLLYRQALANTSDLDPVIMQITV